MIELGAESGGEQVFCRAGTNETARKIRDIGREAGFFLKKAF
jgi:hypothetical protein